MSLRTRVGLGAGGLLVLAAAGCGISVPGPASTEPSASASRSVDAAAASRAASASSTTPSTTPSAPSSAAPRSTAAPLTPAQLATRARTEVSAVAAGQPAGAVSMAAVNVKTGASFSAGATSGMWTASAYKLFVLETVLWRDGPLSGDESAEATTMIENSDNAAGYDLFLDAGGNAGLAAAAAAFGMTHTVPGRTDPTFTTTIVSDYLQLLRNLVAAKSPLSPADQAYVLGLMRNVEADQRWGVGVVADAGTDFANKNGWLSIDDTNGAGEDDNGLWVVSSVGVLTVHGQTVLMAIFTEHQESMAAGVALVQKLATVIAPAVAG